MKKSLFVVCLMVALMLVSSVAFAAPAVQLNGSVSLQYRSDTSAGNDRTQGTISKFLLNGTADLTDHFSLYARFATEGYSVPGPQSDLNYSLYDGKYATGFDQWGFVYKNAGFTYKVGRQDLTIGTTALLYNNNFKVGRNVFNDGLTVDGKALGMDIKGVLVQEDTATSNDHRIYALGLNKQLGNLNAGVIFARYQDPAGNDSTNHWAVNGAYTIGKGTVYAEYARSNAASQNQAYAYGAKYDITKKTNVFVTRYRVETNGDIGKSTDFYNGEEGLYYGLNHNFNKTTNVSIGIYNNKNIETSDKDTSFRGTITVSF